MGKRTVRFFLWLYRMKADQTRRRTFLMPIAYLIPALYIVTVFAPYGYNYFNLFLKSLKNPDGTPRWTVEQVNTIPIAGGAINVIFGAEYPDNSNDRS
jgi:hypothetical protein